MNNTQLVQLSNRIAYLPSNEQTDRPILFVVKGDQYVLQIDGGNSPSHAKLFYSELAEHFPLNIDFLVLTHWHWDHSFGAAQGPLIFAHRQTEEHLKQLQHVSWSDEQLDERVLAGTEHPFCAEMIKKEYGENRSIEIILPQITFAHRIELDLGNVLCEVLHVGGDHSEDSSIIYVREEKLLFLGDCLYPSLYTKMPLYTVANVKKLLQQIEQFDAEMYVLSHELPLTKEEFSHYKQLLLLLCQLTIEHAGSKEIIIESVTNLLGRKPAQLELEAIQCFVNGYEE